jgi:hypothetical protein
MKGAPPIDLRSSGASAGQAGPHGALYAGALAPFQVTAPSSPTAIQTMVDGHEIDPRSVPANPSEVVTDHDDPA